MRAAGRRLRIDAISTPVPSAVQALDLPDTTVARYNGSFFKLRHEIDHLLKGPKAARGETPMSSCCKRSAEPSRHLPAAATRPAGKRRSHSGRSRTQRPALGSSAASAPRASGRDRGIHLMKKKRVGPQMEAHSRSVTSSRLPPPSTLCHAQYRMSRWVNAQ
jgi:hypothetical protein